MHSYSILCLLLADIKYFHRFSEKAFPSSTTHTHTYREILVVGSLCLLSNPLREHASTRWVHTEGFWCHLSDCRQPLDNPTSYGQWREVNGDTRWLEYQASHKIVNMWDGVADGLIVLCVGQVPGPLLFSVENMTWTVWMRDRIGKASLALHANYSSPNIEANIKQAKPPAGVLYIYKNF